MYSVGASCDDTLRGNDKHRHSEVPHGFAQRHMRPMHNEGIQFGTVTLHILYGFSSLERRRVPSRALRGNATAGLDPDPSH